MTNHIDPGKVQNILDVFDRMDAENETAAPDDDPDFDDTAGPGDDDDEVAGAELEAEEGDTGDIRALQRRGRHQITLEEARALQMRARQRGQRVGAKKVQAKVKKRAPSAPRMQFPPNMVPPQAGTKQLFDKWKNKKEPFIVRQEGHYYAVTEIRCICEGTAKGAWCRIPAGQYRFFDRAVGDDITFLGTVSGQVTTNLTNLQRPSKTTYNEQDFLIRSITMQEAGLRVRYDAADIAQIPNVGAAESVLAGRAWLWDDAGAFLPKEIFHDYSGENLLYRALRRSGVLFFNWDKRRTGGNGTTRQVLVDHLRNVPDTKVKSLSRTSGGAPVLPVPDGYIFTDNPERSEEGAFSAVIMVHEDIAFPIKPIDLGMGSPMKPVEIGLYVQLSLNGVSFEHAKRAQAISA
ncbi:hypothetical protein [Polyangium spumosum]|uniref:Uncharacterized protein n=1 Tax=Polyangium spumosum TaxID=889282 RepID=A0A6N7Q827_9BACT|nr:hypothetical protein [Polyangium spumosum]MRG98474.1 hypothetical protein [Polyangium spumosum]